MRCTICSKTYVTFSPVLAEVSAYKHPVEWASCRPSSYDTSLDQESILFPTIIISACVSALISLSHVIK